LILSKSEKSKRDFLEGREIGGPVGSCVSKKNEIPSYTRPGIEQ